ncbi:chemotaxis protein methyltransferase CheR [Nitrosomonas sp. Nm51]|uniref:CheR family methyltransferase n=1 Tax=Nitrosomonas sp. Nm51 TaxID=133720 RepID=UPI0008B45032|nr:CheR family methyltransferase [Nitrosomonas sp. Nm51]SEQ94716.1 chemotaxis protein methyltransferase CheR [Nitrosomonas sp. Nm51]
MWETQIKKTESASREYTYTQADFEKVKETIYAYTGISLSESKHNMVYSRLARRLRVYGLTSFKEYLSLLDSAGSTEQQEFVNALTTNLTAFFRENHHFPILEQHLKTCKKPRSLHTNDFSSSDDYHQMRGNQHKIHLWCTASSTGEEPYSMAITAIRAFNSLTPPVHILATDIDTQVLQKAREGIYTMDRVEKLPQNVLQAFFYKGKGRNAGTVKVRDEVRNLVTFRKINLLENNWSIRGAFQAIFCRNVMIYFDKQTQYKILKKFAPLLDEGGLLFAGHSESLQHASDLFKLRSNTVYEVADNRNKS